MNYLHITYIYPQGTPPVNLEYFDPVLDRIEQYDSKFSETVPTIGEHHNFDDADWQVVAVHPYKAIAPSNLTVYEIWCSQDGSTYRRDWRQSSPHHLAVEVGTQGELLGDGWIPWSMFPDIKRIPQPGTEHDQSPGWILQTVQQFRPVSNRPIAGFDSIHLCFFAKTAEPVGAIGP